MKKKYCAPVAKMIDFSYDEQVVAASTVCNNYNLLSKENPDTCFDEFKDIPLTRMFSNCQYTDKEL